jgi:hypothetical protein
MSYDVQQRMADIYQQKANMGGCGPYGMGMMDMDLYDGMLGNGGMRRGRGGVLVGGRRRRGGVLVGGARKLGSTDKNPEQAYKNRRAAALKRPRSGWQVFLGVFRDENYGKYIPTEVMKRAAKEWRKMHQAEKDAYTDIGIEEGPIKNSKTARKAPRKKRLPDPRKGFKTLEGKSLTAYQRKRLNLTFKNRSAKTKKCSRPDPEGKYFLDEKYRCKTLKKKKT